MNKNFNGEAPINVGIHSKRTHLGTKRILLMQSGITLVLALLLSFISLSAGYSALIGGGIWLIANAYAAKRALSGDCASQNAQHVLATLYVSEIWKVGICITLFGLTFVYVKPLSLLSLFSTFILMQVINVLAQMKLFDRFLKL